MIVVYPKNLKKIFFCSNSQKKILDDLIIKITNNVYTINMDKCYNDKINYFGRLILKDDEKADFIPNRLKDRIKKILLNEIDLKYDILEKQFDDNKKEEEEAKKLKEKEDKENKNKK